MSTRFSFLLVGGLSTSLVRKIAKGIAKETYVRERANGFIIQEQSNRFIRGEYVQRLATTQKVTDPFGVELAFPVVSYLRQTFELSSEPGYLMLANSCSAAKALTGRLADFADFGISIETFDLEIERVLGAFRRRFGSVHVDAAVVKEFSISNDTIVKVYFQTTGQLESRAREFLRVRSPNFSAIKFTFDFAGAKRSCEVKSSGTITVYGEYDPLFRSHIIDMMHPLLTDHARRARQ